MASRTRTRGQPLVIVLKVALASRAQTSSQDSPSVMGLNVALANRARTRTVPADSSFLRAEDS